jgi:hypothetical protein
MATGRADALPFARCGPYRAVAGNGASSSPVSHHDATYRPLPTGHRDPLLRRPDSQALRPLIMKCAPSDVSGARTHDYCDDLFRSASKGCRRSVLAASKVLPRSEPHRCGSRHHLCALRLRPGAVATPDGGSIMVTVPRSAPIPTFLLPLPQPRYCRCPDRGTGLFPRGNIQPVSGGLEPEGS